MPRPDRVAQALVATEDSRFHQMPGIDPISVVRVGLATLSGSSDTGGATLEQQLAKNLYFPHDDGFVSKVQEAELALKLDVRYPKNEILRLYLADVYFGHGFYGLPAAAEGYFGVTPAQLSWAQASMIAGLVQAPSAYDPIRPHTTPYDTYLLVACASNTFCTDSSPPAACPRHRLTPPSLRLWACNDG